MSSNGADHRTASDQARARRGAQETASRRAARKRIAEIMRESLAKGCEIEIEGLGTFRAGRNGYEFSPQKIAQVFIAYVCEDLSHAERLCQALRKQGCSPWLDKEKLLAGQNWRESIERAIEVSDVFVACFSPRSVAKRGMFQQELRHAVECARRRPLDDPFLLPVRLEPCSVPRRIADQVQYVDLFPDWENGIRRLTKAIRKAARNRPMARLA